MAAATDNDVMPTVEPINVPNAPDVRQPTAARHFAPGVGLPNLLRHAVSRQLLRGSNTRLGGRRHAGGRSVLPRTLVSPGPQRIEHCGSDSSAPSATRPPPWGIRPFLTAPLHPAAAGLSALVWLSRPGQGGCRRPSRHR